MVRQALEIGFPLIRGRADGERNLVKVSGTAQRKGLLPDGIVENDAILSDTQVGDRLLVEHLGTHLRIDGGQAKFRQRERLRHA